MKNSVDGEAGHPGNPGPIGIPAGLFYVPSYDGTIKDFNVRFICEIINVMKVDHPDKYKKFKVLLDLKNEKINQAQTCRKRILT